MKDEIYRVAIRHGLPVSVVAGKFIRVPQDPLIERVAAGSGMDAADNWIAERAGPGDIVITSDIPLASRCVKAGAEVMAPNGKPFTEASIGMTLAVRNLMTDLRSSGEHTGGPKSFDPRDRSNFLSTLDQTIRRIQRRVAEQPDPGPRADGAAAYSAQGYCTHFRRHAAADRRRAERVRRGARLPDRPQRFRQVDAAARSPPAWSSRTPAAASCSPALPSAICRRSRISASTRPRWLMSRQVSVPATIHYQARYLLEQLGLSGDENPAPCFRRRSPPRGVGPRAGALARHPAAGRADQPSRPADDRMAGGRARQPPLRAGHHQPRPPLPHQSLARDRLARPWQDQQIDRGFAAFEAWRDEVLAEEERDQHKLDRKIVNEEHWLRYGVSGRRKRNVKRLGNLHALREQRRTYRGAAGNANLAAAEAEKSGRLVIEAKGIGKAFGDRTIVDGFSIRVQRGDRIGIVGPNGAGKTTLVNLLTGAIAPDSGGVRLGANIEMATLDQHRESLDPNRRWPRR